MARFKECRLAAGLPQKAVALELAVKQPSISDWESGRTFPTVDNLIRLADLYGVSIDCLLGREKTKKGQTQNSEEAELLAIYRQLTPAGKAALLAAAEGMLAQPGLRQAGSIASGG